MTTVDNLIELIRDGHNSEAIQLLKAFPSLAKQRSGQAGQLHGVSPLHWAAHRNAIDVCQLLIEMGADVNDSVGDWWLTPLAWGADAASVHSVELLLKQGADVDQDAIVGTTALHAVAMGGSSQGKGDPSAYSSTAEMLITYGADINKQTIKGRTPLDEAIENTNDAVAKVLRQHGAVQ